MKMLAFVATALMTAGLAAVSPALALQGKCATCNIKTKQASTAMPGKFDFEMACVFDITGEEMKFTVVAVDEDQALQLSQTQAPADCW